MPGDERDRDDDEVEDVPAVAEEVPRPSPVGPDPEHELDDEDDEAEVVDEIELVAVPLVDSGVGLEPEHDGVDDDHDEDRRREPVRGDDAGEAVGQAHRRVGRERVGGRDVRLQVRGRGAAGRREDPEHRELGVRLRVLDDVHLARAEPERDARARAAPSSSPMWSRPSPRRIQTISS